MSFQDDLVELINKNFLNYDEIKTFGRDKIGWLQFPFGNNSKEFGLIDLIVLCRINNKKWNLFLFEVKINGEMKEGIFQMLAYGTGFIFDPFVQNNLYERNLRPHISKDDYTQMINDVSRIHFGLIDKIPRFEKIVIINTLNERYDVPVYYFSIFEDDKLCFDYKKQNIGNYLIHRLTNDDIRFLKMKVNNLRSKLLRDIEVLALNEELEVEYVGKNTTRHTTRIFNLVDTNSKFRNIGFQIYFKTHEDAHQYITLDEKQLFFNIGFRVDSDTHNQDTELMLKNDFRCKGPYEPSKIEQYIWYEYENGLLLSESDFYDEHKLLVEQLFTTILNQIRRYR